MPRRPAPKRPRERTFDGCATCRTRKIKCDGRKPFCSPCEKRGLKCSGFQAKIQYVHYDHRTEEFVWGADHDTNSLTSRRLLSSEEERASMSRVIASAARYHEIDDMLENADQEEYHSSGYRPFLTIKVDNGIRTDVGSTTSMLHTPNDQVTSITNSDAFHSAFHSNPKGDAAEAVEVLGRSDTALIGASTANLDNATLLWSTSAGEDQSLNYDDFTLVSPISSWSLTTSHDQMIPQQAIFLLDHYRQQMVKLFSPKGSQSPPWAILHLPSALATLSELTIYGNVSSARASLFYSLLAVSAFNLDRINLDVMGLSNFWSKLGDTFRSLAKREVKRSMTVELSGFRASKYKDTLMALLSMVTISVVSGKKAEARSFLLDAEQYILLKGIEKANKSRKVYLIHQIYLFLRTIEESTHVYSTPTPIELQNLNLCSDFVTRHAMFPSLRTQAALMGRNIDLMTDVLIDRELTGEIKNGRSLFEEIYGVPIQLLSLISKVTWLANEVRLRDGRFGFDLGLQGNDLAVYARELEDMILAWTPTDDVEGEVESGGDHGMMQYLILAIYNALIIYFYRRIYDINARVLQPYVEQVASHLFAIEQQKLQANLVFNAIAWPGFIAASEAIEPLLRCQLSTWLRNSAQESGFRNFDVAESVAQQVWRLQDSGHNRASWIDLVEQKRLSLVMT